MSDWLFDQAVAKGEMDFCGGCPSAKMACTASRIIAPTAARINDRFVELRTVHKYICVHQLASVGSPAINAN
jgi:hypothetical protein